MLEESQSLTLKISSERSVAQYRVQETLTGDQTTTRDREDAFRRNFDSFVWPWSCVYFHFNKLCSFAFYVQLNVVNLKYINYFSFVHTCHRKWPPLQFPTQRHVEKKSYLEPDKYKMYVNSSQRSWFERHNVRMYICHTFAPLHERIPCFPLLLFLLK